MTCRYSKLWENWQSLQSASLAARSAAAVADAAASFGRPLACFGGSCPGRGFEERNNIPPGRVAC